LKILFIGDIVARSGREAIRDYLRTLKSIYQPDIVIANGENSAHGSGHTPKICAELYGYGIDIITSGNHIWGQREIIPAIDRDPKLIRPINLPRGVPGRGHVIVDVPGGRKIMVINAMGRLFMDAIDDPFTIVSDLVDRTPMGAGRNVHAIFVDFHAETSSEKQCFANYLDGRISAMVGTHTHVPTADARILPRGTAYQTDAGMTGDYNSSLGRNLDAAINRFTRKMPGMPLDPTEGPAMLCGTFIETDDATGLTRSIVPVRIGAGLEPTKK
jgi:metallophosphoesterase (TIGR00282 family)